MLIWRCEPVYHARYTSKRRRVVGTSSAPAFELQGFGIWGGWGQAVLISDWRYVMQEPHPSGARLRALNFVWDVAAPTAPLCLPAGSREAHIVLSALLTVTVAFTSNVVSLGCYEGYRQQDSNLVAASTTWAPCPAELAPVDWCRCGCSSSTVPATGAGGRYKIKSGGAGLGSSAVCR